MQSIGNILLTEKAEKEGKKSASEILLEIYRNLFSYYPMRKASIPRSEEL
jgi:hypothetical protein